MILLMLWTTLKTKYGGKGGNRETLNAAVRAEIPGGAAVIDAVVALLAESQKPKSWRHPAQTIAIRKAYELTNQAADALRQSIIDSHRDADGD